LVRNAGGNLTSNKPVNTILVNKGTTKDSSMKDNGNGGDPAGTNCCKHKISDKENSDTWAIKKSKVCVEIISSSITYRIHTFVKKGTGIHIKLRDGKKMRVKILIDIST
jgi:hypothetical protein